MAAEGRSPDPGLADSPLAESLREDPCSFEFFQAVTLLQRLRHDCQPVGAFFNPDDEAVHFRVHNRLPFPASQVQELNWPDAGSLPEMVVNFMGLTGPSGVLPYWYTEHIIERLRAKDDSLPCFLDIFNHRAISFFYRAWSKYRFPVSYNRGDQDRFTKYLLDLIGLGTTGLQERQSVPDEALLHYVALFAEQSRSAEALEGILSDYFRVPVEVEQFTGSWYRLEAPVQCSLADDRDESRQLGGGAVVGDEVWDRQGTVRIKLGPMELSRYSDFLPDGSAFEPLKSITRFFSNGEFDFEVQLLLVRDDVPACDLGSTSEEPPRLGWVSWLKTKTIDRDPGDTILRL
jgi:type VI secretion system protein ImpH